MTNMIIYKCTVHEVGSVEWREFQLKLPVVTDCPSIVEVDSFADNDHSYTDDQWHSLIVLRDNELARIEVDQFKGQVKGEVWSTLWQHVVFDAVFDCVILV